MPLITREELMELRTREGLENWLRPGTRVRLTEEGAARLAVTAEECKKLGYPQFPFVPEAGATYTIAEVTTDSYNPNWTRFTLVGVSSQWRFAPESLEGLVVWEPVE